MAKASFVCDPDALLKASERYELNGILRQAARDTVNVCDGPGCGSQGLTFAALLVLSSIPVLECADERDTCRKITSQNRSCLVALPGSGSAGNWTAGAGRTW